MYILSDDLYLIVFLFSLSFFFGSIHVAMTKSHMLFLIATCASSTRLIYFPSGELRFLPISSPPVTT